MSEKITIPIMMSHNARDRKSMCENVCKWIDRDWFCVTEPWVGLEFKELFESTTAHYSFKSIWAMNFEDKAEFNLYKLKMPEQYKYVKQFQEDYEKKYLRTLFETNYVAIDIHTQKEYAVTISRIYSNFFPWG